MLLCKHNIIQNSKQKFIAWTSQAINSKQHDINNIYRIDYSNSITIIIIQNTYNNSKQHNINNIYSLNKSSRNLEKKVKPYTFKQAASIRKEGARSVENSIIEKATQISFPEEAGIITNPSTDLMAK